MEFPHTLLPLSVVLLYMFGAACSLECKECSNVVIDSDSGSIASKIGIKNLNASPGCRTGTSYTTVQCPDSPSTSYMCKYVEGSATFNTLFGSIKVGVHSRGCAQVDTFQSDGCVPKSDVAKKVIGGALSILAEQRTEVDGQICYCGTDMCTASPCDGVFIRDVCIPKWGLGLIGTVGLIIAALLLSCCCCCCCTCCRSKPRYVFVQQPVVGGSTVVSTNTAMSAVAMSPPADNGVRGMENPTYDKMV